MAAKTATPQAIVVDTREQRPFEFGANVEVQRAALPAGDYSVPGLEDVVAVERKSLSDLVGSLTQGRERFWRELQRLQALRAACVVVEASLPALWMPMRSKASPESLFGSTLAIIVDLGVPVFWCGNADLAARFTVKWLARWARRIEAEKLVERVQ